MTDLRPIETASYASIKTPSSLGRPPRLEWIPIRDLVIDPEYQREITDVGRRNVRQIASEFNWSMFAPVVVAPAGSSRFAIVDGQHRATAAALCGVDRVPCAIIEGERAAQAAAFKAINGNVTKLSSMQLYHAAVAAGDERSCVIARVCSAAGVTVLRYPKAWNIIGVAETMAPAVIARVVGRLGAPVTTLGLKCIVAAGVAGGLRPSIIIGTCDLLHERPDWRKDLVRLEAAFHGMPLDRMLGQAATEAAATRGTSTADAFRLRLNAMLAARLGQAAAPVVSKPQPAINRPTAAKPNGGGAPAVAAARPAAPVAVPKPAAAPAKPAAPRQVEPPAVANGVTVNFDPDDEAVTFRGKSMEVTYRQAKVAAMLARAMPHPVARSFIVRNLFDGNPPATADMVVDQIAMDLGKAVAGIGLKVNVVKSLGFSMGEAGK
jgi:hypothetical protein